jgi:hypothetical protein
MKALVKKHAVFEETRKTSCVSLHQRCLRCFAVWDNFNKHNVYQSIIQTLVKIKIKKLEHASPKDTKDSFASLRQRRCRVVGISECGMISIKNNVYLSVIQTTNTENYLYIQSVWILFQFQWMICILHHWYQLLSTTLKIISQLFMLFSTNTTHFYAYLCFSNRSTTFLCFFMLSSFFSVCIFSFIWGYLKWH